MHVQGQAAVQALARQARAGPQGSPPRLPGPPRRGGSLPRGDELDVRPPRRRFMPQHDVSAPVGRGPPPPRIGGSCTLWVGQVEHASGI